jgi:hypothetical protein
MRHALCLAFCLACSKNDKPTAPAPSPRVSPAWAVATQVGLTPKTVCTCATPGSSPAPTPYEAECDASGVCGDVHYAEFLERTMPWRQRDRLGRLLEVHEAPSFTLVVPVYDATVMFEAPESAAYVEHDSQMLVHVGDVIPTPQGTARVVQIHRSFVEGEDDGRVELHFLERFTNTEWGSLYVTTGAPSHLDGHALMLMSASGGDADIAIDGGAPQHVRKEQTIKLGARSFRISDVASGRGSPFAWVTLDTQS